MKSWGDFLGKYTCDLEYVPFDGIFHNGTEKVFNSFENYAKYCLKDKKIDDYKWIGILTHRNNWFNKNIYVEEELIKEFETLGFKVIPVFSYSTAKNTDKVRNIDGIVEKYFSFDGKLIIDGLVNLQMLQPIDDNKYTNIFEQAVVSFKKLSIPIFKPLISYMFDIKLWEKSTKGLSMEMASLFTNPEMVGMIEPIIIGCRNESGKIVPIQDRIHKFAGRVKKWIDLRNTPNRDKKIAIFIHNAPCSGVEATIGMGVGLEVFESVIEILESLKENGYKIGEIPESGEELRKIIMNKKAYNDFRWTAVEDIIEAGGIIYTMPLKGNNGYMKFYNILDEDVRNEMEETWGEPPGEGMVYDNKLVITGVNFGNVNVMVQPKRGCYGAKCTGEVCKALHDPKCPPPHQYIATYKYVEKIMKANAIIHVGTSGSIEYLPGKTNALSEKCYPDIAIGEMPSIYIYNAGIGTEGTIAKRRSNSVIIDYLPSCMKVDINHMKMISLINEYMEAKLTNSNQKNILREELETQIEKIDGVEKIVDTEYSFDAGIEKLKNYMIQAIDKNRIEKLHVFGKVPRYEEMISIIKEYLDNNSDNAHYIKQLCDDEYDYNKTILELIDKIIMGREKEVNVDEKILEDIKYEILSVYKKLFLVEMERENLIKALDGKFIEPGLSGMPSENFEKVLPTGRNFYLMDCEKIPTRAAYEIGKTLADKLIGNYIQDEGKYPNKVAMNMISTDISGSKGEQLSQILYLMGVTPIWDGNGRVLGLDIIPLEELNRPRIDVIVRISGVLRDSYPDIVEFIDKGAVMVSSLNESTEYNFVKKNTLNIESILEKTGYQGDIRRRSTIRVFGDRPGAYGTGVDLALKASAWKEEKDIAKVFVYFSSYAYGENLDGIMAEDEFVENIKESDISYEKTHSNRYDMLSSSFSASVHGGIGVTKEILSGNEIKQYHGSSINKDNIKVSTLKEEIKQNINDTFFNPLWKENIKEKGYRGATDIMRRIQNIFDWQCLSENIDNMDIDNIVDSYVNDEKMFKWFNKHNKYAIEEISRRFLELYERKKWNPDKDVLDRLRKTYIKIEGNMEELSEKSSAEIQGGTIEVLNQEDIGEWKDNLGDIDKLFDK